MKLKEMIDNGDIEESEAKIGYVGAFPYAEVISGYTAFYLGVKSIVDSVKMKVRFTNSWYDEELEKEAAEKLIDEDGCKIISQHADSSGAPSVCEEKSVPNVFYNGENPTLTNSYLISSRINWRPYFKYFIQSALDGTEMDPDWTGTLEGGSVEVYNASSLAATGTQDAVDTAISDLKAKNIKVFDTSKFTVNGTTLTSYMADVDTDANFEGDTEAISDGYFHESEYRSAPYFDIIVDGIEIIEEESESSSESTNQTSFNTFNVNKKGGLSTGGIIGVTIPLVAVAVVAAVAAVIGGTAGGVAGAAAGSAGAVGGTTTVNNASVVNASVHKMIVKT